MAIFQTHTNHNQQPGFLRLPTEIRIEILRQVLHAGEHLWTPHYTRAIRGFSLHNHSRIDIPTPACRCNQVGLEPVSVAGIISANRLLRQECHALLAHEFTFVIHIDVSDSARTNSNSFERVKGLDPLFRSQIRSVAVFVHFLEPMVKGTFDLDGFVKVMNPVPSPLMFEKIVENVNEITSLLLACEKVHFVWYMFFGNGGLGIVNERYTRNLIVRCRKELGQRVIQWTAQNWMGQIDIPS